MSTKVFFASVIVSILILAPVTYFVLPILYPGMNGVLIQSQYVEFTTEAYIFDDSIVEYVLMPDTQTNITTQGDSSLVVLFSAVGILTLSSTFVLKNTYSISLVISGVGNRTILVAYYDGGPVYGDYRQLTYDITVNFATGTLTAGTYIISLYWISNYEDTGMNSLSLNHNGTYEYDRSLWIQEIYEG